MFFLVCSILFCSCLFFSVLLCFAIVYYLLFYSVSVCQGVETMFSKGPEQIWMFLEGGPRWAQSQMRSKGCLGTFLNSNQSSQNILEMFPAGRAQGGQGQMPSKMCPGTCFQAKSKGARTFSGCFPQRWAQGGPGPDAFKKVP